MYWKYLVKETLNKNNPNYHFVFTNFGTYHVRVKKSSTPRKNKVYPLGENFPNVALTRREAQCMRLFLDGKTIAEVAQHLNLSPRTIEFYMKNMKKKLNCRRKTELMEKILNSDFNKFSDFE